MMMSKDERGEGEGVMVAGMFVALLITLFAMYTSAEMKDDDGTSDFEIWDAKCPFGHYYTDTEGGGGFLLFTFDSGLGEGYVFKFFQDGVLRTLIVESTDQDCRIHLTDDTSRMWMQVHYEGATLETQQDEGHDWIWMDVYVPDPKVM